MKNMYVNFIGIILNKTIFNLNNKVFKELKAVVK